MRNDPTLSARLARSRSIRFLNNRGLKSAANAVRLNQVAAIRDYHNTVAAVVMSHQRNRGNHGRTLPNR
jgi:hypothetical protein